MRSDGHTLREIAEALDVGLTTVHTALHRPTSLKKADPKAAWRAAAIEAITKVALHREAFTTDSIWHVLEHMNLTHKQDPRALGGLIVSAVSKKLCTATKVYIPSSRLDCGSRPIIVYKSKIFDAAAHGDEIIASLPAEPIPWDEIADDSSSIERSPIKDALIKLLNDCAPEEQLTAREITERLLSTLAPDTQLALAKVGIDAHLITAGIATHLGDLSRWFSDVVRVEDPTSVKKRMLYSVSRTPRVSTGKPRYGTPEWRAERRRKH